MNKKELVESVSIERNLTKKEAELLVDTVFNTITRSVVEGDRYLFLDLVLLKLMIVKLEKEFLLKLKKK